MVLIRGRGWVLLVVLGWLMMACQPETLPAILPTQAATAVPLQPVINNQQQPQHIP